MADLGHGKTLNDAAGIIGVSAQELPPLPDDLLQRPNAGRVDPRRWFLHPERPFEIEIGCGKGTFLVSQAPESPLVNYLGIEWAREYYLYSADRLRRRGVENVRMLHADASEFLRWRCQGAVARTIHLYFSDPWPKRKHHKNRVIQDAFLAQAWRVLLPLGELRIVTDHDELWAWDQDHFARWTSASGPPISLPGCAPGVAPFEQRAFEPPAWVGEGQLVGTNYERKMCGIERTPHAAVLRKTQN